MADLIASGGQAVTMTSMELVDFINSQRGSDEAELRHDHFMAKVPKVLGVDGLPKFRETYYHPQNGQGYPCYRFPKREACLMAMSYSYEMQAKVFDRMTALEAQAVSSPFSVPQTRAEALRLAADLEERNHELSAQVQRQQPAVEFVGRYVESTGVLGFRQVCKLLSANENAFRRFLIEKRVMYILAGDLTPFQQHLDAGRFQVRAGVNEQNQHAYTQAKFTPKGIQWIASLWMREQMEQVGRRAGGEQ